MARKILSWVNVYYLQRDRCGGIYKVMVVLFVNRNIKNILISLAVILKYEQYFSN